MTNKEITTKLKRDKRVSKFMQDYRYNYKVTMVTDLAELAYSFYLEGFKFIIYRIIPRNKLINLAHSVFNGGNPGFYIWYGCVGRQHFIYFIGLDKSTINKGPDGL